MEEVKKEATAGTMATENLQARIEQLSLSYVDFFEKLLENPESVNPTTVHALNDCVRILHHLKKINAQLVSHS